MDEKTNISAPASPAPEPAGWRAMVSAVIGLLILVMLAFAGGDAQKTLHLSLPGPVVGLGLLAGAFLLFERHHKWLHRHLKLHVAPISRLLVSHMGLLFVPAGVGIITEGDTLHGEWLPILTALAGSTLTGLIATGWVMHRFAAKKHDPLS